MGGPPVSVVLPVRDGEAHLGECIESILAQTLDSWELVVVDDGSTDRTPAILAGYSARDRRIRVLTRPPQGVAVASNEGFEAALAPLVARMDADDVALPRRLESQVEWMRDHPELAAAGCRVECFPLEGKTDGMHLYESWLNGLVDPRRIALEMFVESPLPNPGITFRKDVFLKFGGYRDGAFPEDYDLLLRMHRAGYKLGKVSDVLLRWRDGADRLTRKDPRYSRNAFRRLKAHHMARSFAAGGEVQIWGAGREGRLWRVALAREGVRVARFFDVDEAKIGRVLGGGARVFHWSALPEFRGLPLICAVAVWGARAQIRESLDNLDFIEGEDYLFVS
ncbi:MAG: glycosyltransferase [Deltaproteobacteria bacterium]|nr:glycosyltransferase [Deltaproteobacteria bacterium]